MPSGSYPQMDEARVNKLKAIVNCQVKEKTESNVGSSSVFEILASDDDPSVVVIFSADTEIHAAIGLPEKPSSLNIGDNAA